MLFVGVVGTEKGKDSGQTRDEKEKDMAQCGL